MNAGGALSGGPDFATAGTVQVRRARVVCDGCHEGTNAVGAGCSAPGCTRMASHQSFPMANLCLLGPAKARIDGVASPADNGVIRRLGP